MPLYDIRAQPWIGEAHLTVFQVLPKGNVDVADVIAVHTEQDWCLVYDCDAEGKLVVDERTMLPRTKKLEGVFYVLKRDRTFNPDPESLKPANWDGIRSP
jgi:hypothetical protein